MMVTLLYLVLTFWRNTGSKLTRAFIHMMYNTCSENIIENQSQSALGKIQKDQIQQLYQRIIQLITAVVIITVTNEAEI